MYVVGAVTFAPLSVYWTQAKRGDKPWSNLHFHFSEHGNIPQIPEKDQARWRAVRSEAIALKAKILESPLYFQLQVGRKEAREISEDIETQYHCMIEDGRTTTCLPKPPDEIVRSDVRITISAQIVMSDSEHCRLWLLHAAYYRLAIPIALLIKLINTTESPISIDRIAVEATAVGGWQELRPVGSLEPDYSPDKDKIIISRDNPEMGDPIKGLNLLSKVHEITLPPKAMLEGWLLEEFPHSVRHGDAVGEIRIAVLGSGNWVGSIVLNALSSTPISATNLSEDTTQTVFLEGKPILQ